MVCGFLLSESIVKGSDNAHNRNRVHQFLKWHIYFSVMSNNDDRRNSSLFQSYVSRLIQSASKNVTKNKIRESN